MNIHPQQHVTGRWTTPPQAMCKLNIYASLSKAKITRAVGAIFYDEHGNFLGNSARVIEGISDPETLEPYACSVGLAFKDDLHIGRILLPVISL
jgi:hypothetical protein